MEPCLPWGGWGLGPRGREATAEPLSETPVSLPAAPGSLPRWALPALMRSPTLMGQTHSGPRAADRWGPPASPVLSGGSSVMTRARCAETQFEGAGKASTHGDPSPGQVALGGAGSPLTPLVGRGEELCRSAWGGVLSLSSSLCSPSDAHLCMGLWVLYSQPVWVNCRHSPPGSPAHPFFAQWWLHPADAQV